jgi:hypothetical protein
MLTAENPEPKEVEKEMATDISTDSELRTRHTAAVAKKLVDKKGILQGLAAIFGLFRGHKSRLKYWCFWIKKLNKYKLNILAFGKKNQFAIF